MARPALLLLLLACAACQGPRSPYRRYTVDDGRIHYAHTNRTLRSHSGGFVSFKDLVTRESVRLKNGTFTEEECPPEEVDAAQQAYLSDPTQKPHK